ncbi:hypothetical protein [Amycolatopsis granulosa]|uniref:hypothetical protein n=1 Tax=Amycolatopsis granulosa TaxID=185684 RepID=UPI0014201CAA|nr:hypothetical protein [Amycolatopsis granulosa]NIH88265.1 hypothetical protein [Amycolatopsis granulosa]
MIDGFESASLAEHTGDRHVAAVAEVASNIPGPIGAVASGAAAAGNAIQGNWAQRPSSPHPPSPEV